MNLSDRLDKGTMFEPNTGCWLWIEGINPYGYGQLSWQGHPRLYHRLRYILAFGEIPKGLCVLHVCDNRLCGNPNHLFLGTRTDNALDRDSKGRCTNGLNHYNSKFDLLQVKVIKSMTGEGISPYRISKYFNVCRETIRDIQKNKNWKNV